MRRISAKKIFIAIVFAVTNWIHISIGVKNDDEIRSPYILLFVLKKTIWCLYQVEYIGVLIWIP